MKLNVIRTRFVPWWCDWDDNNCSDGRVVKYENGMYWLRHIGGLKHYDASLFLKFTQIEVIGNTFEHPELLGEP